MRTLSAPAQAALLRSPLPLAVLVEMDLTLPLNLNTASIDLVQNGATYYGTKGLGKIEAIQDTPAEVKQLRFELSAVPSTMISLALQEPVQGKAVRIKLCIFDPDTYQVLDTRLRWSGLLDVFSIEDQAGGNATLQCTAEHAGIDLIRPTASYYSDSEQRRLNPGDFFFQFNADQVEQRIVWPDASFGRV